MKAVYSNSEVKAEFDSYDISDQVDIIVVLQNYFLNYCKLVALQYSTDDGVNWEDCLDETEYDIDYIQPSLRSKKFTLTWDAIQDLWQTSAFSDVQIRLKFEDPNGEQTDYITFTIDELDFTPNAILNLKGVKPYDPNWDISFQLYPIHTPTLFHFVLEIADSADFSNVIMSRDSESTQSGWTVNGSTIDTEGLLVESSPVTVNYSGSYVGLTKGVEYYLRVRPKVMERYELYDKNDYEMFDRNDVKIMVLK